MCYACTATQKSNPGAWSVLCGDCGADYGVHLMLSDLVAIVDNIKINHTPMDGQTDQWGVPQTEESDAAGGEADEN